MPARNWLLISFLCFLSLNVFCQQQVTFEHQTYVAPPNSNVRVAVDLNNDRATDIVTDNSDGNIYVILSNGDGSFQPPRSYPVGTGNILGMAAGDVDGDGNADVVVSVNFYQGANPGKGIVVFYGKGDGTLSPPVFYPSDDIVPENIVIADFTGDGRKDILVTGGGSGDGNYYARLYTNAGNRTFIYGGGIQISNFDLCCDPFTTTVKIGDFDGDGHADFFVQRDDSAHGPNTLINLYLFYGDGAGHFIQGPTKSFEGNMSLTATDLNQDGKSDISGVFSVSDPSFNYTSKLFTFYGNASRALTETDLATFTGSALGIQAADFNGDGTIDLAFLGGDGGTWFALQKGGVFTIQKTGYAIVPQMLGDFNRDNEPDLAQIFSGKAALDTLQNTTANSSNNFCSPPAHGISICQPAAGSTNPSPMYFTVGAADFSPIRKIEIWVNGSKLKQSFYSYFDYSYFAGSLPLSNGTQTATIVATGFDHTQMKKNVTFTVGFPGCSAPSTGIHVCQPQAGSTVPAGTVHVQATGVAGSAKKMEVWVDGVKKASSTSNLLNVNLTLGVKGRRRFDFYSYNSAGQRIAQATIYIFIG